MMWNSSKLSALALVMFMTSQEGSAQTAVANAAPAKLGYEVRVTQGLVRAGGARLPSGEPIVSSPITSTLIFGRDDAILVDPPMSIGQTREVVEWIARSGKHLKYIYTTHGHGDHWAGTRQILERFPDAVAYATPETIGHMHQQNAPELRQMFERNFPGQIGDTPVLARPIPAGGLDLEGNLVLAVAVGHSDTDDTTVLYVPSLGLVAAGDVVYNGIHPFLLESGNGGLDAWLHALDKVDSLHPQIVIAGHKNQLLKDDPHAIADTRKYLQDARRLLAARPKPLDYYQQMISLYPDHLNTGPLWYSGLALLSGTNLLTNGK